MIYERPKYRLGGDSYVLVDFGDELNILLNFKCLALEDIVKRARIPGVIETASCFRSIIVRYDNLTIRTEELIARLGELVHEIPPLGEIELQSRVVEVPTLYDDRWTRECTEDYNRYAKRDYGPDCEFVSKFNRLRGVDELIEIHTATEYWVGAVGFTPGEPNSLCLDRRYMLKSPHYNPPRLWTPEGTVAVSDGDTGLYSVDRAPGGYRMIGRSPIKVYDPGRRNSAFGDSSALIRVGDRLRFMAIDEEQYARIREEVEGSAYRYRIKTYEVFSVKRYMEFVADTSKEVMQTALKRGWKVEEETDLHV